MRLSLLVFCGLPGAGAQDGLEAFRFLHPEQCQLMEHVSPVSLRLGAQQRHQLAQSPLKRLEGQCKVSFEYVELAFTPDFDGTPDRGTRRRQGI